MPPALLEAWDVVLPTGRKRSRPRRVHGEMHLVAPCLIQEVIGLEKLGFSFAGKADDDISGYGDVRHGLPSLGDPVYPEIPRVSSPHPSQHVIVAGLNGHVHVLAHRSQRRHALNDLVRHVTWM